MTLGARSHIGYIWYGLDWGKKERKERKKNLNEESYYLPIEREKEKVRKDEYRREIA